MLIDHVKQAVNQYRAKPQWLEHPRDHEILFWSRVVLATDGQFYVNWPLGTL